MASVNYKILGKSNPANIYLRFLHGRQVDLRTKINIYVNPIHWDAKNQKIKNVIAVKNRDDINRKLGLLKIEIVDNYNAAFMDGDVIDKDWLAEMIDEFFNRPKKDKSVLNNNHCLYYVNFAEWWIINKSKSWLTSSNSFMTDRETQKYNAFISMVDKFSGAKKIKLGKSGNKFITDFVMWLNENGYAEKTIKRHVGRVKFFFARAKEEGFKIDPTYEQRVFIPKSEEVLEPVLNPEEIQSLFKLKLPSIKLENARDNLIIACWTGLRISDFMNNLDISNFIDDFIEITTTKTKTAVVIPIHPMIKKILIKHKGKLPKRVNDSDFNLQIKLVCEAAGIKEITKGRIYDKESKRKVLGLHPKFKLITSHSGRRSFATNLFGKIELQVISSILGHSTTDQTLDYIKKSNREQALKLKEYWDNEYKIEKL